MAVQPISMPSEMPSEIKALIDKVVRGFNNKDSALYNGAFGRDAVVIDGIPPYGWTGSNAQACWFSDAEKWAHNFGVENETIVCDKTLHAAVVGTYAYVVISATLFFKLKGGQSDSKPGILTFTCAKQPDEWKVRSQAWAPLELKAKRNIWGTLIVPLRSLQGHWVPSVPCKFLKFQPNSSFAADWACV